MKLSEITSRLQLYGAIKTWSAAQVLELPVKFVTREERDDIRKDPALVAYPFYPESFEAIPREIGYDEKSRYVLAES